MPSGETGKGQNSALPAVEQHQNAENPHPRTDMDELACQVRREAEQPPQHLANDEQAGRVSIRDGKANEVAVSHELNTHQKTSGKCGNRHLLSGGGTRHGSFNCRHN